MQPRAISRADLVRGLIEVSSRIQIVGVGLLFLPLQPARLGVEGGVFRTFGLGVVVTILSGVICQVLQPATTGPITGAPSASMRASNAVASVLTAFAIVFACRTLSNVPSSAPAPLFAWSIVSATIAAALQMALQRRTRLVVVGEAAAAADLANRLEAMGTTGLGVAEPTQIVAAGDATCTTQFDQLDRVVASGGACTVIIAGGSDLALHEALCSRLADTAARVLLAFPSEAIPRSPFAVAGKRGIPAIPLVELLPLPVSGWYRGVKRGFDLSIVILLMPLLASFLFLVALAIKLDSPGPVLFRQWRFGRGSRPVLIYKFRTMRVEQADATGAARTQARDPRVTRVGRILRRLSIDELPQIINVLRDEMSLVGPRPHPTHMKVEDVYYHQAFQAYRARHRMLPGITGWAQINGSRGEVDTFEKARRRMELDLWYVANWSPFLDFWILLRTALGGFATFGAD